MARKSSKTKTLVRSPSGSVLTELILTIFKVNADLLAAGNAVTHDVTIISVRWQLLTAVSLVPKTAAQIGREIGLSRQGTLWNVQELVDHGFVELIHNPDHRRAKLVSLTDQGRTKLAEITNHQISWVNALALNFEKGDLDLAVGVLSQLSKVLRLPISEA
ncbi:MarR family winged helix-turn-helix transcriptional regulator [Pseudomonas guariconensis]|uniref:MarR family winged helix-turn-helix transcriptional regulator n=1 Tax=Pseudomonas guariconensis TaxID=1288410 RepID=UPI0018A94D66|nr:MarR family winged helix-turn-helix transcriptional regulator [Pseudomonas guariconensis]MBF8721771.1 winged helix-turn-helix transcriptional regulator [Pseudomonas guariconensis]